MAYAPIVCVMFYGASLWRVYFGRMQYAPTWVIRCKKGQKIFRPYQTLSVLICAFGAGDVINMYFWAYAMHPYVLRVFCPCVARIKTDNVWFGKKVLSL